MTLTIGKVKRIEKLIDEARKAQEVFYEADHKLWHYLEPLVDKHDLALDKELLDLIDDYSSYAQFELRRRIRALENYNKLIDDYMEPKC